MFQNCMVFVKCGTCSCIETCVTYDVDGSEEGSIKVEESIDIKDEILEAITFRPVQTEHPVSLWGMFEVVAAHALSPFIAQTGNCEITLSLIVVGMFQNAFHIAL
jgi:hypothetical protein